MDEAFERAIRLAEAFGFASAGPVAVNALARLRVRRAMAALCALTVLATNGAVAAAAPDPRPASPALLEFGVDRSNMGTQWTLAWPQEPKVSPFLAADYNKPGNFEARRVAVMDGIARVHAGWFRDGFGKGSLDLFVDLVKLAHTLGMKILAVFGAAASDFPKGAYLSKEQSGCQWGTYPSEQDQPRRLSEAH